MPPRPTQPAFRSSQGLPAPQPRPRTVSPQGCLALEALSQCLCLSGCASLALLVKWKTAVWLSSKRPSALVLQLYVPAPVGLQPGTSGGSPTGCFAHLINTNSFNFTFICLGASHNTWTTTYLFSFPPDLDIPWYYTYIIAPDSIYWINLGWEYI